MPIRDEYESLQEKAHNRIIATKIQEGMSKIRAEVDSNPATRRRWIWELIQNAKDVSIDGQVDIRVELKLNESNPRLIFKHTGRAFSVENIRFLIEQVSSKDRTQDATIRPTTTGKFGTGFLSTHLLSERVLVKGVLKGKRIAPRRFSLWLDRRGPELEDLIDAVQAATDAIQGLDDQPAIENFVRGNFNTAFRYDLEDQISKDAALAGIADLDLCLPYTLVFVPEIASVEYPRHLVSLDAVDELADDGVVKVVSVVFDDPNEAKAPKTATIATLTKGLTTIAMPLELQDGNTRLLPLKSDLPRLFCDFPLVGTEHFPFPVVINNPTFNPTEPRDGVFLTASQRAASSIDHNKGIILEAQSLYLILLEHACQEEWHDLHLLAAPWRNPELHWLDQQWYKSQILNPMRSMLKSTNIVRTAAGTMAAIKDTWFPSSPSKKIRRAIWECCKTWIPHSLPAEPDIHAWHDIIWSESDKLTLDQVSDLIEECGAIDKLASELEGIEVHDWLMAFYDTLKLDEPAYQAVVSKRRIFPNQNGKFRRKADLARDAGDIDQSLLDVLQLLGHDLRDSLLDAKIETAIDDLSEKDEAFVVKEISAKIEKSINDRSAMKGLRPALDKLLLWFRQDDKQARKLFPMLYKDKHLLYDDEEILNNIELAEELNGLLNEYKVTNVTELRSLISRRAVESKLLPVNEQIIASLGITTLEDWEKALEDKDLAALFSHESTATVEMFLYVQTLIRKARKRVVAHLSELPEYDLSEMDETARTVLAGVKKDGRDMTIVFRPAYDGTVIIYYQSEKDVLDYVDHELWVDTGDAVRRITFGHVLKKAKIRRFPI